MILYAPDLKSGEPKVVSAATVPLEGGKKVTVSLAYVEGTERPVCDFSEFSQGAPECWVRPHVDRVWCALWDVEGGRVLARSSGAQSCLLDYVPKKTIHVKIVGWLDGSGGAAFNWVTN